MSFVNHIKGVSYIQDMKISHISSFITATDAERKQRARCCFKATGAAVKKIDNMY